MNHTLGQSLAELLVSLSLISILAAIALPSWSTFLQEEQQRADTNQLLSAINFSRTQAVLAKTTVTLCPGEEVCETSKVWEKNLLAFSDPNQNGIHEPDESVLRIFPLSTDITWHWNSFRQEPYLQFERNGTTRALNGTFSLCSGGHSEHKIVISLTGKARTARQPSSACRG